MLNRARDIPELNRIFEKFTNTLKSYGIKNYLLIADDPSHPLGGASAVSINDTDIDSPIPLLDEKFKEWKLEKGISIEHDWNQDGWNNLNKGLNRRNERNRR